MHEAAHLTQWSNPVEEQVISAGRIRLDVELPCAAVQLAPELPGARGVEAFVGGNQCTLRIDGDARGVVDIRRG